MVLDSDAHEPEDLLTLGLTRKIAMGAGLTDEDAHTLFELNLQTPLGRLEFGPALASLVKVLPF